MIPGTQLEKLKLELAQKPNRRRRALRQIFDKRSEAEKTDRDRQSDIVRDGHEQADNKSDRPGLSARWKGVGLP